MIILGYSTEFTGRFTLDRKLEDKHYNYLKLFSYHRHMKIKPHNLTKEMIDAGVDAGLDGAFFAFDFINKSSEYNKYFSIISYNEPPELCPGLWCQWIPSYDKLGIEWDGGEKFYNHPEWIEFIQVHFLNKWNYKLSGSVFFQGEDYRDKGYIRVKNNKIFIDNEILIFE